LLNVRQSRSIRKSAGESSQKIAIITTQVAQLTHNLACAIDFYHGDALDFGEIPIVIKMHQPTRLLILAREDANSILGIFCDQAPIAIVKQACFNTSLRVPVHN
jgi:hypothetical protein